MNYHDVYHLIFNRPHKRWHGVLGAWKQIKGEMFALHVEECEHYAAQVDEPAYSPPAAAMVAHAW